MLYQWRKNGVDIGGDSSSYTTGTLALGSDNLSWFDCVLNDTGASAEVITRVLRSSSRRHRSAERRLATAAGMGLVQRC